MFLFLIIAIGYLIGRIRIKGISLGMSAILIVALFFGHYGFSVPGLIKNLGLACFATAVGYITGPVFLKNFKNKALYYVFLGFIIIFKPVEAFLLKIFKPIYPIACTGICFIVKMAFSLRIVIAALFFVEIAVTLYFVDIDPAAAII